MFPRLATSAAILALACGSASGQTATLRIAPSVVVGTPGGLVDVPVQISTPNRVTIIRFTLEYNTAAASFVSGQVGADGLAAGFTLAAVNPNLSFAPKSPGTNDNVLVLALSSSSGWITGDNKELVVLRFQVAAGDCRMSPLNFDPDCNHTDGSTFESQYLCGPSLHLFGGAIGNGCASDALAESIGLRLLPNSPNPFNPTTRLAFEKPFDGPATLEIVSVAGHRVRTVLRGEVQAGRHELTWDGNDETGTRVAAGVYYARLATPEATVSRSLVLVQ